LGRLFSGADKIVALKRCSRGHRGDAGYSACMSLDPVVTNPDHYKVVFENDRVRVLEYTDQPGDRTTPHEHPDSVMYTLSSFRRRLASGNLQRDVELAAGTTNWLPAQQHSGENIGDTPTHVVFVELKPEASEELAAGGLGPS
jgi:quercetin dioxygenase-like cupin family protein